MILVKTNPTSPGCRHKRFIKKIFCKNNLFWWQKIGLKKTLGRDNFNGILTYSKKSKPFNKVINYLEKKFLSNKKHLFISFINYKNNKSYFGLVKYTNNAYANVIVPHGSLPGDIYKCTNLFQAKFSKYNLGDSVILLNLSRRYVFYNIFLFHKNKCVFSKAPGTFSSIISNETYKGYCKIKMPSGDIKCIYNNVFVTLGRNSNMFYKNTILGKAGESVKLGFKSSVRGVAMNPVDHPHGGRTKTNSPEKTPWGKVAKKNK